MRKIPPYLFLDFWRGLAALLVVTMHSCLAFLTTAGNEKFATNPFYFVSMNGRVGVTMFFVLSGYCITGAAYATLIRTESLASYAWARVRRIYPPFWAACALALTIGALGGIAARHHLIPMANHANAPHSVIYWVCNLLNLRCDPIYGRRIIGISWTLCYEVVFYAIIGILLGLAQILLRKRSVANRYAMISGGIGVVTLASLLWLVLSRATCPFPLDRWYQFGLGGMLFCLVVARTHSKETWSAGVNGFLSALVWIDVILAVVLSVLQARLLDTTQLLHDYVYGVVADRFEPFTCLLFLAILGLMRPLDAILTGSKFMRPFLWLGTISYSLYLVHLLFLPYIDAGMRKVGFDHGKYLVTYFVEVAFSIFAGWLFHILIERHFISSRQKRRITEEFAVTPGTTPSLGT